MNCYLPGSIFNELKFSINSRIKILKISKNAELVKKDKICNLLVGFFMLVQPIYVTEIFMGSFDANFFQVINKANIRLFNLASLDISSNKGPELKSSILPSMI